MTEADREKHLLELPGSIAGAMIQIYKLRVLAQKLTRDTDPDDPMATPIGIAYTKLAEAEQLLASAAGEAQEAKRYIDSRTRCGS